LKYGTAILEAVQPGPVGMTEPLDGQVCWLLPEELRAFLRSCWAELELAEGSTWAVVRRHWRRSSLRWHPATAAIRSCGCESNGGL
jgi:hypothetical protein